MRLSLLALPIVGLLSSFSLAAPSGGNSSIALKSCVQHAFQTQGGNANQRIVDPSMDTYTDSRMGEKIQFDEFPALLAYAVNADEVGALVKCAQQSGYKAVPRTGGHHFLAYSALNNTLVIDIGHINYVKASNGGSVATVGAGIRLGALYTALDAYNTTWIGGICPTVGLSGLVSSGGFNMQMRALGMSSDYVLAAKVVTADGSIITASPTSHSDLFWALRGGGGGTYGILVELTLSLRPLPRSAMVAISWNDSSVRYDVAKQFLDWAPKSEKEFTSQVNVYKSNVQVLGWYLGKSQQQLQSLINSSGLLKIGKPQVQISGNCDTDNSRVFGYTTTECVPDNKVDAAIMNVVPDPFTQYDNYPQFKYKEVPLSSTRGVAPAWSRFRRLSKSFFLQKSKPLPDDDLKKVVDMIGQLDDASQVWGEWHAWNLTSTIDSAFPWRKEAYAHLEFQVHGSNDTATQTKYENWFANLESFLRPIVGPASYSGYMDKGISTNPFESYYGSNVCRLVQIKKTYDPNNFFTNPDAIPPTVPQGISC
ncbi:hypothetical protein ANI_1_1546094 [Paecilomyces variotii No. 5]|uniref:FAD-binding PCMH-type domain-containing protein n=1 Tax=Byssochlamys spectabilis (strain No. 5 / NBRC 109023) TaxID=1356009 RepID=V5I4L3_BYSSN|nr:hypothetical protein ANI_1_1546094 [Paecilomyces variotii No. 5]